MAYKRDAHETGYSSRLLLAGLFLTAGYFIIASANAFFIEPNLTYFDAPGRPALGEMPDSAIRYFFKSDLSLMVWQMALLFPAALCFAFGLALRIGRERTEDLATRLRAVSPAFALAFSALFILAFLAFWSGVIYQGQPLYDDEGAFVFQARVLLAERWYAAPPPVPACFENQFMILRDGVWTGLYTLGQPLLIALGLMVGVARLVPFLLCALTPALIYLIGKEQYDRRTGLLAAAFLTVSPFFLFTGATLMNHGTLLFFLALFTWAYLKTGPGAGWVYPLAAGLALGFAFNIRPQDTVGYGAPFAIWSLIRIFHSPQRGSMFAKQAAIGVSFSVLLLFALYYNKQITGSYSQFPFQFYDPSQRLGFGSVGDYIHTPLKGAENFLVSLLSMNLWLYGWPFSLIFAGALILAFRHEKPDRIHYASAAGVCLVYWLYYIPAVPETGPRYWFALLIPVTLLSARGALGLHRLAARLWSKPEGMAGSALVPAFIAISILLSALTFGMTHALHYQDLTDKIAWPYRAVEKAGIHNAIVAIQSRPRAGWIIGRRNPKPDLTDDVIYVSVPSVMNAPSLDAVKELRRHFLARKAYVLSYDDKAPGGRISLAPLEE
ncbi:MAG: glycosyltransferase family 39 protein [Candidatus Sumerlaeota bacterium]|nr:glycosyltransferase family 39 protein [Candidatus Sumerlaeota bacterium]